MPPKKKVVKKVVRKKPAPPDRRPDGHFALNTKPGTRLIKPSEWLANESTELPEIKECMPEYPDQSEQYEE